jgi:hypothetical protein
MGQGNGSNGGMSAETGKSSQIRCYVNRELREVMENVNWISGGGHYKRDCLGSSGLHWFHTNFVIVYCCFEK